MYERRVAGTFARTPELIVLGTEGPRELPSAPLAGTLIQLEEVDGLHRAQAKDGPSRLLQDKKASPGETTPNGGTRWIEKRDSTVFFPERIHSRYGSVSIAR